MPIVSLDYETFYDKDYSLSKISEVEYILSPKFEPIMVALKIGDGASVTHVGEPAMTDALNRIDWSSAALLCHNTRFDGAILAWHFGHTPKLYLDTLSMARATTHWNIGRSSLKAVSDYLGLPPKGDEVVRAMGKRLRDFYPDELAAYEDYCKRDNDNCYDIFQLMRPIFSASELQIIDLILRMFIHPQVRLNTSELETHLAEVRDEKQKVLAQTGYIDKKVFSSSLQFAALLESHGVEVPTKVSPTTGREIPAVAKNDRAFRALCEDEDQPMIIQSFLAARLSVRSTIEETRTEHLLRLSKVHGWGAVPLKYSGARTHRLSGDGGTNWQNFKRGSRIRAAIQAPPGMRIVHRDASQIEARMVAWLAGCSHLLYAFSEGRDVYCEFASSVYGRHITKADTMERFVGKTCILGLGYGCGPPRFRDMLFTGNGGISLEVDIDEAKRIVYLYRDIHQEIRNLWAVGDYIISAICACAQRQGVNRLPSINAELSAQLDLLPVQPGYDALWLPSGLCIAYPGLHFTMFNGEPGSIYFDPYKQPVKLYGAKVVENVSQALARIVMTDAMVRVYQETGKHPFLSTHDSLDYCVPEAEAETLDQLLAWAFAVVPTWAEGLPLASEGGWGHSLLDAEQKVNR